MCERMSAWIQHLKLSGGTGSKALSGTRGRTASKEQNSRRRLQTLRAASCPILYPVLIRCTPLLPPITTRYDRRRRHIKRGKELSSRGSPTLLVIVSAAITYRAAKDDTLAAGLHD
ncbi:hypothetical protein CONLIGDRAFT_179767 [Coniochaeta ligniaria NRRL 30616]|uniref:Uncharacterized protein n=1 Tax=Coniochaeta ligniaria NRRL 30616 TaxID=1408157 RepID=A0A1J7J133_9PEZI|nr:hypothetical protein CONLIGDRAFT_179767 [Coniochaeta ligniaria NRRL 30616]